MTKARSAFKDRHVSLLEILGFTCLGEKVWLRTCGEGQMGVKGGRAMKRHMTWSMLIGLLIVLGLVGVAAAQQPRSGGTLRVAWEADISGLDPHVVHDRVSQAETALHNAVLLVLTL